MSLKYNHQTPLIFISAFILLPSMPGVNAYYGNGSSCDSDSKHCVWIGAVGIVLVICSLIAIIMKCNKDTRKQGNSNTEAHNNINATSMDAYRATVNANRNNQTNRYNQTNRTTNSNHHVVNMTGSSDNELTQQSLENEIAQPPPPYSRDTNLPKYNNT